MRQDRSLEYKNRKRSGAYFSWAAMIQRCCNLKHKQYDDYGGRGITVCSTWKGNFKKFLEDMGERPEGKTLERLDKNGPYTKNNCTWATYKEQNNNRRQRRYFKKPTSPSTSDKFFEETGINI